MKGADEYAALFTTGQYGKFYIVSGRHARGPTFHIYILPDGEKALSNGENNGPRNSDAVEVYGIVDGQPGWTESYGWLHLGKWQRDFYALAEEQKREQLAKAKSKNESIADRAAQKSGRIKDLLDQY